MNRNKIHPQLLEIMEQRIGVLEKKPISVIVECRDPRALDGISSLVDSVVRKHRLIDAFTALVDESKIDELSNYAWVTQISFNYDRFHKTSGDIEPQLDESVPLLGAEKLWKEGYEGQGVSVGICDTEFDPKHPDLMFKEIVNLTNDSRHGTEEHGTHVSGIVAGSGKASGGKYRGLAPKVELHGFQVLDSNGGGTMSDIIEGVERAVDQGLDIINLSLGSDQPSNGEDPLSRACAEAAKRGVWVFVAAGNDGEGLIGIPAAAKGIAVCGATDKQDNVASFSSRGNTLDGRYRPTFYFPGVNIKSARAFTTGYISFSGTSMATPGGAGSAAAILSALKAKGIAKPSLARLIEAFQKTAKPLYIGGKKQPVGRAQVYEAYKDLLNAEPEPPPEPPPEPEPNNRLAVILTGLILVGLIIFALLSR